MVFPSPSSKEHTVKRTAAALVAVVLAALSLAAVASAKTSPRGILHGGGYHVGSFGHGSHVAHLGHHHLAL